MYKIYANGAIMHSPLLEESGCIVSDPIMQEQVNSFGELTFSVMPGHPLYRSIKNRLTYVTVRDERGDVWRGRVISNERAFDNRISVTCEGELAYLLDSIQRPFTYYGTVSGLLTQLITAHNAQMITPDGSADTQRRFTIGTCNVPQEDPTVQFYRASESAKSTWALIREKLLDPLGGYLRIRMQGQTRYLDYLTDSSESCGQSVEYGKNLLDLTVEREGEDVITALIPYGASYEPGDGGYVDPPSANTTWDGNRRTVRSVNNGSDEIMNAAGIAVFGRIYGTRTWDTIYDSSTLYDTATAWLAKQISDAVSIAAKAIDKSYTDDEIDPINCFQYVRTKSKPHEIDVPLLCVRKTVHLMDLSKTTVELGTTQRTLTEMMGGTK